MPRKQNNNRGGSAGIGVGLGLAAIAAAAGAYYFYGSRQAAKNRKAMKGWMIKARGEVVERLENLKDLSEDSYNNIVTQVTDRYKKVKNIDPSEVAAMAADLRRHWKNIATQLRKSPRPSKRKQVKAKRIK